MIVPNAKDLFNSVSKGAKFKISLINCNTMTKIEFDFTPDSLADNYDANYVEKQVLGRSNPLLVYTGGSSRGLSFTVVMHEDLIQEDDIRKFVDKIRALSLPVYDAGVRAPSVYCRLGEQYSFWGVLNTSITYMPPVRKGRMIMASIQFNFTRLSSIPRQGGHNYLDAPVLDAITAETSGIDRG